MPNLIKELLCEYFNKSLYADEIINCYMILIFTELIKTFHYDTNKSLKNSKGSATVIDILQYLEENYMTCTLASTLLSNSDMPIYEIANEIGYQNLNFFYKKFENYFGVTPNEFREKNK